ncbi:hypothetical protein D3C85_1553740 [compost metagenome]
MWIDLRLQGTELRLTLLHLRSVCFFHKVSDTMYEMINTFLKKIKVAFPCIRPFIKTSHTFPFNDPYDGLHPAIHPPNDKRYQNKNEDKE